MENKKTNDHSWGFTSQKWRQEGKGIASIEDSIDATIQRLRNYTEKRREKPITATRNNTDNMRINRTKMTWKQKNRKKNNAMDVLSD